MTSIKQRTANTVLILAFIAACCFYTPAVQSNDIEQEIIQTQQKIDQLGKLDATPSNKQLKDVYQQILSLVHEQQMYEEKTQSLYQQSKEHTSKIDELADVLDKLEQPQTLPDYLGLSLQELDKMVETLSSEKNSLKSQFDETQNRLTQLQVRLIPAQGELSDAKKNLDELNKDNKVSASPLESNLAEAMALKKKKAVETRLAQIKYLDLDLLSIPNQIELTWINKEILNQKLKNLDQKLEKLQTQSQLARQAESATIIGESLQLRNTHQEDPALKWLAEENAKQGSQLTGYAEKDRTITEHRARIEEQSKQIEQRHTLLQQDLSLGGDTEGVGELMRQTLLQLKSLGQENTAETIAEIQKAQIQALSYDRQRIEITDKSAFIQSILKRFPESQLTIANNGMRERLSYLLDLRLNLIYKLLERNQQSLKDWSLLLNAQNHFNDQFEQFDKLLKENLLWTPTNQAMNPSWLSSLGTLMDQGTLSDLWTSLQGRLIPLAGWLSSLLLAYSVTLYSIKFSLRPRFQVWQKTVSENIGNVQHDSFGTTLLVLLGELFFSLPSPLFLLGLRKIALHFGEEELWVVLLGAGLRVAAIGVFYLGYLRRLARPDGLLESHLLWPVLITKTLYRELQFAWLPILLLAFTYVSEMHLNVMALYEFGRLPFLALCLVIAGMVHQFTLAWRSSIDKSSRWSWNVNESPFLLGTLFVYGVEIAFPQMDVHIKNAFQSPNIQPAGINTLN